MHKPILYIHIYTYKCGLVYSKSVAYMDIIGYSQKGIA